MNVILGPSLTRHRSADSLVTESAHVPFSRHPGPAPSFSDLAESEVFVGDEEEFYDDKIFNPHSSENSTNVCISYSKDGHHFPLNSVQEDVEAEEAEELSLNFASTGPSSLGSLSVVSSMSLDEFRHFSSDTRDLKVPSLNLKTCKKSGLLPSSLQNSPRVGSSPAMNSPASIALTNLNKNLAKQISGRNLHAKSNANRSRSLRISYGLNSSSDVSEDQEVKTASSDQVANPRSVVSKVKAHSPRICDKVRNQENQKVREHKISSRINDLAQPKRREVPDKTEDKEHQSDSRFNSLGRKKKVTCEQQVVLDTYATLGRSRRKESESDSRHQGLSQENKNTLDKFATLPRRKAREMSARWREQNTTKDTRQLLQRSLSVGRGDSSSGAISPRGISRNSPMTSSYPACTSGNHLASTRLQIACHGRERGKSSPETSTILPGSATAARAQSRLLSSVLRDQAKDKYLKTRKTKEKLSSKTRDCHVQADVRWSGESELEAQLRHIKQDHTELQEELIQAQSQAKLAQDRLKALEELKSTLQVEKLEKNELQEELERTSLKVKEMLMSMEGVEREFNNRGDSLIELECQLQNSTEINVKMQEKINQYEDYIIKLRKDLDKSLAAQKTLLQQVQELEGEGREMSEFMAAEKNALSECLREAEVELQRIRSECELLSNKLKQKDEEARHMVRLAEERRKDYVSLQSELDNIQTRTQDMMVCQGADVSAASVGLTTLHSRLSNIIETLTHDYSVSDADIDMIVTPAESDSSLSSPHGSPEVKARTPSPRKRATFMQIVLGAIKNGMSYSSKVGDCLNQAVRTGQEGRVIVEEQRNPPEGSESAVSSQECPSGGVTMPTVVKCSLVDQVYDIDHLLSRFLKVCVVLKNSSDVALSDTQDENERLCAHINSQQQMIEQQQADYECLSSVECKLRKEVTILAKELEKSSERISTVQQEYEEKLKHATDIEAAEKHFPNEERELLNNEVQSLMRCLQEREQQLKELRQQRKDDLVQHSSITAHILETLESVPDAISNCPPLAKLLATLQQSQMGLAVNGDCKGLQPKPNWDNWSPEQDCNANPTKDKSPSVDNGIITLLQQETHL